jgi:hypothetical protein
VCWTHNDGSDGVLHAVRPDGSVVARVRVDTKFADWEDVAIDDKGGLYLADVGNNSRQRKRITVHRVDEPDPHHPEQAAVVRQQWKLAFPEEPFDCESLFVWRDHGYLISKVEQGRRAAVYRFALTTTNKRRMLEQWSVLPVDEPVTAADISEDGASLAVLIRGKLYLFQIDGDVKNASLDRCQQFTLPRLQAEGCCFAREGVYLIAETGEILFVRLDAPSSSTTRPTSRSTR